jgi:hypothetical protein
MSEPRNIAARGLTKSNVGSSLLVDGKPYIIEDIRYSPGHKETLVKLNQYIAFGDLDEVTVID